MSAAAIRLLELDIDASIVQTASTRVRGALDDGSSLVHGAVVCYYLHRAQAVGDRLRQELSEVSAESLDGRSTLRAAATSLGEAARALEFANCRAVERGISRWPVFGRKLTTQLEELSCTLEDASKAADLRASAAFSRAVRNVLTQSIHRTQSVADQSSSPPARAQSSEIFSVQ